MSVAGGWSTRRDGANAWPPFFFNDRKREQAGIGEGNPLRLSVPVSSGELPALSSHPCCR